MIMNKISEILKGLDSRLSITVSLITIITVIGGVFVGGYKLNYAQKCALYYGIPEKYFKQVYLNINFYKYLPAIIALAIMLIILLIKKNILLSDNLNFALNSIYGVLALILITFINNYHLINIVSRELNRKKYVEYVTNHLSSVTYWIYMISAILGVAYTALFIAVLINDNIKWCKAAKSGVVFLTVLIGLISVWKSLPIEPEKKSQYEVTLVPDGEELDYRVVLADLGEQYLTVSFRKPKDCEIYEFYTGNYKLLNKDGLIVSLRRFNSGIKIVNNDSVTLNN